MTNTTDTKHNLMRDTTVALKKGRKRLTDTYHDLKRVVAETKLVKVTMVNPLLAFLIIGICMAICLIGGFIVFRF